MVKYTVRDLKEAYEQAIRNKKDFLKIGKHDFFIEYVKYFIEYLKKKNISDETTLDSLLGN